MTISGEHLGMTLAVDALDHENAAYFGYLANGEFRLQRCVDDGLFRYPPSTRCPFCGGGGCSWEPVDARGAVYSYSEVHHAIQPAFKDHVPYMVLMVELDAQRGQPGADDGLRIVGNLVTADGEMAPPDLVARVGIGSRVRMVIRPAGDGIAMAMWTPDEEADQPVAPWRYPG